MKTYETLSKNLQALISKPQNESKLVNLSLDITDSMETFRGICWTAELKINGKTAIRVANQGDGGCNDYHYKDKNLYSELVKTAELAYPNDSEPLDTLVAYLDVISSS